MSERHNHLKTVSTVMLLTLIGKVLGLVRDMLMGHYFGTGMEASAFTVASQIPRNFFDAIFASAISASFIPVFNDCLEKKGKDEAFRLSNSFITLMGLFTILLSAAGIVLAGPFAALQAGGEAGFDAATLALCTRLLRILFPTIVFTGLAFSMVGVLQSLGEFSIPAVMSAVSNGVIILYYLFLCRRFGVYGLAAAFLAGWALQAVIQVPALRKRGYHYRPAIRHPGLKSVFLLMGPVMVSTWIQPINLVVSTRFAADLNQGQAVAAMNYANSLYTMLAGILVLSLTNVIFPELSRLGSQKEEAGFGALVASSLRSMLFLLLPMMVGLMIQAQPLIRLLYEWGEWTAESTALTARALAFLALGMVGYGIQNVLSRAFYAVQSGRVPLITGLVSIALNVLLCLTLSPVMGIAGLALASALSSTVSALLLLIPMGRKHPGLLSSALWRDVARMAASALVMGAAALLVRWGLSLVLSGEGLLDRLLLAGVPALAGAAVYFPSAWLLRVPEMKQAAAMIQKILHRGGN